MDIPIADLQAIIILVALVIGAIRGVIGYWLTAPETEPFNPNKLGRTAVRYALVNFVGINLIAAVGEVTWTAPAIVIYTLVQLAVDVGIDLKKT